MVPCLFVFSQKEEAGVCGVSGWVGVASPRCGGILSPPLPIQNLRGQGESRIFDKLGGDLPSPSARFLYQPRFLHIQPRQEAGDLVHSSLVTQPIQTMQPIKPQQPQDSWILYILSYDKI